MSAESIHSAPSMRLRLAPPVDAVAVDAPEMHEELGLTLEPGAYNIKDEQGITEARRLTARRYLAKGFITEDMIGEDGTITADHDPYIASSDYYIAANENNQVVATTRKIRYDTDKGEDSFPAWKSKDLFDKEAVSEIEAIGLENCVEISALAKDNTIDTDKTGALNVYRSLLQDSYKSSNESVYLMTVSPQLYSQFSVMFKGGIKRIGPNLDYPGEEVIPAIFKPVDSIIGMINSSNDAEDPEAATTAFVVEYLLDGCPVDSLDPAIVKALKDNGKTTILNKLQQPEMMSSNSSESVHENESVEDIEELEEKKPFKQRFKVGAVVGAALVALAFQQSPGNEAVRTAAALNALQSTDSELIAGGAVAGLTMAIEGGTSALIAAGLHQKKSAVKRVIQRFKRKSAPDVDDFEGEEEPKRGIAAKSADLALALSVGPGIAMTKRHMQEKEPTFRRDIRRGLGYSAIGATVSGGIGYLVTGGIQHAEKIGLETPAEYIVNYGTDWKFWTSLLVGGYGLKWTQEKARKVFGKKETQLETIDN